ncbi:MAG: hypothetical protein ACOH2V_10990, partial [Candidatus Saccharimonadaceae bacterium]
LNQMTFQNLSLNKIKITINILVEQVSHEAEDINYLNNVVSRGHEGINYLVEQVYQTIEGIKFEV